MATHSDRSPEEAKTVSAPADGSAAVRHQTRNLFATVRSIISLSATDNVGVESFAMHLVGRIDAMARANAKIERNPLGLVDLEELIADELITQGGLESSHLQGPEVRVSARTAEVLGLVFNELATNSLKFGALAYDAKIAVRWRLLEDVQPPGLEVRWSEHGVPAIDTRPQKRGFGLTLIEEALTYDLGGEGVVTFAPGGVECTIRVPLAGGAQNA